jgi:serine/threonine protein kinase
MIKIYFCSFFKGVKGVVQLIDLEASSNNMKQQRDYKNALHIVTERPSGYSLNEFVNKIHRGGFRILEAIQLVQNLITIVKRVHSKGVLHQNLGPENIMIEWNSKQTSIDQAQLTLINFSQAYIKSDRNNRISPSTTERWYNAPQANDELLKYTSTIDASSICAILLWLLTNIEPRHDGNHLPHERQDVEDKINRKITETIKIAST